MDIHAEGAANSAPTVAKLNKTVRNRPLILLPPFARQVHRKPARKDKQHQTCVDLKVPLKHEKNDENGSTWPLNSP